MNRRLPAPPVPPPAPVPDPVHLLVLTLVAIFAVVLVAGFAASPLARCKVQQLARLETVNADCGGQAR